MPRANRTIAPMTSIPQHLDGGTFLYYLNTLIEQLNTSFADLDLTESALRGEEGYTATIGSNLEVQGHTVTGLRSPLASSEAVSLADLQSYLPAGVIVMWSGSIASIPIGWALCNGTQGTPDLRDRFIVGARQDDVGVAKTNITGALTQSGGSINYTPAGTNSTTSGGTPAGTNSSDSAGTPAGTVSAIAATATATQATLSAVGQNTADQVHTHPAPTFTGDALGNHAHTFTGSALAAHGHTFSGTAATIVEPYYALAFIQKL